MRKKVLSMILGTALAASMLAGCGSKEEAPAQSQTEAKAAVP